MYLLLRQLRKLYKVIVSETKPSQIAAGFCFGVLLGLTPLLSLHNLLLVAFLLLLRVNISACFLSMGVFKLLSVPLSGAANALGASLLTAKSLHGLWRWVAWNLGAFELNNTQVLGSLLISLVLCVPVFFGSMAFVKRAREILTEGRKDHWLVKLVSESRALTYLIRLAA